MKTKIEERIQSLNAKKQSLVSKIMTKQFTGKDDLDNQVVTLLQRNNELIESIDQKNSNIVNRIDSINELSEKSLSFFENLKYRKRNTEKLINVLASICELNKLLPSLEKDIDAKVMTNLGKYIKSLNEIFTIVPQQYFEAEQAKYVELKNKTSVLAKKELEDSILSKDITKIEYYSTVLAYLGTKENLFERFLTIYMAKIDENLSKIIMEVESFLKSFTSFKKQYFSISNEADSQEQKKFSHQKQNIKYPYFFFKEFVEILHVIFSSIEHEKDNELIMASSDNFYHFIQTIINKLLDSGMKQIFADMLSYFNVNVKSFILKCSMEQIDLSKDHGKLQQQQDFQELTIVNFYVNEVAQISNQFELFKLHIQDFIIERDRTKKYSAQKNDVELLNYVQGFIYNIQPNKTIFDLTNEFLSLNQALLKLQRNYILTGSEEFIHIFFADRNSFSKLLGKHKLEELTPAKQTSFFEFLDEFFYILRESCFVSFNSLNKVIVCQMLQFVSTSILQDSFYKTWLDLGTRLSKESNFSVSGINFHSQYSTMNAGSCLYFNLLLTIINYLKRLKEILVEEISQSDFKEDDLTTIKSCIVDIESINIQKFRELLNNQLKVFARNFVKISLKNNLEILRDIRFKDLTEEMIQVYQKNAEKRFSYDLTKKIDLCLHQWNTSLIPDNYESFVENLAQAIAEYIEKIAYTQKFNLIGGVLFDKEIRAVSKFFNNLNSTGSIKKNFSKLSLLSELLMLDSKSDLEQYYSIGLGDLNNAEINKILKLRVDLK